MKKIVWAAALAAAAASWGAERPVQAPPPDKLAAILQKALSYCLRLDKAALDFVCQEQVEEDVNQNKSPQTKVSISPAPSSLGGGWAKQPLSADDFNKTMLIYDYQFIRKGAEVKERRDLMEKNGDKVKREDVTPETKHFKFRDILFGPSYLLGAGASLKYSYTLAAEDKIRGDAVISVACLPLPALVGRVLSGRAVVRVKDGAVLKIDWDPESFGSYDEVLAVADRLGMKPKIQSYTEFGIEKNGVRFPTYDFTEEAYAGAGKDKYVRSTIQVKYKSYKFFTVETQIEN